MAAKVTTPGRASYGYKRLLAAAVRKFAVLGLLLALPTAEAAEVDRATGLIKQPGWEQVRAQCGGCHSYGLIIHQRADRDAWQDMIRWMQRTQNLWEFPPDVEAAIIGYLAANYPPQGEYRRAPLPPHLMPVAESR